MTHVNGFHGLVTWSHRMRHLRDELGGDSPPIQSPKLQSGQLPCLLISWLYYQIRQQTYEPQGVIHDA